MNRQEQNSIETTLDIYFKSSPKTVENVFVSPAPEIGESSLVLDSRTDEEVFADFIKSQEGKYITKEDDKYVISRVIKGERKVIARFTLYEYAAEYERNLIVNGWHDRFNHNNTSSCGKFITQSSNKYQIVRTIEGKKVDFGSYPTLEEALLKREELIDDNWGTDMEMNFHRKSKFGKYISYFDGVFKIQKVINGDLLDFGYFDTIDDAIIARDILVENNWDDSKVPENLYSWRFYSGWHPTYKCYEVYNLMGTDLVFFGLFKTKALAKKAVGILRENHWDCSSVPLEYYRDESNIREHKRPRGHNFYSVVRKVNDGFVDYGSFRSYDKALELRNELISNNWAVDDEEDYFFDTFIHVKGDTFSVENDGVVYGVFDKICDASDFVNECVRNNWWNGDSYFT